VRLGVVVSLVAQRRIDAPFRSPGVTPRRVELGNDGDASARIVGLDRSAHAGAAGTHDDDVEGSVHRLGNYRMSCDLGPES
jgi:hypothetical protein